MAWVKFHDALMKGAKRALPRAVRFVFMELAILAREHEGMIPIHPKLAPATAAHDLLGGAIGEIAEALATLVDEGMISLMPGKIVIPNWLVWNSPLTSGERVARHREKKRHDVVSATHGSVTACNDDVTDVTLQEREKNRLREDLSKTLSVGSVTLRATESSGTPPPFDSRVFTVPEQPVLEELQRAPDVFEPDRLPAGSLRVAAVRMQQDIGSEPTVARTGLSGALIVREAVDYVGAWRAKHPSAGPAEALAEAKRKVGWILGDIRAGKRNRAREGPTIAGAVINYDPANDTIEMDNLEQLQLTRGREERESNIRREEFRELRRSGKHTLTIDSLKVGGVK